MILNVKKPKIIPQQSATTYHILQFHIVINIVHFWDPTECDRAVRVYIYIYIDIAFYLLLKYCIDGPMVDVNYRHMKLFLNKGSCVPTDSKQYFKHCTNTMASITFNFTLCIPCVEYIDRNRIYTGTTTTHNKNHLHTLDTSPATMHIP
jgi:hypothetical protein